MGKYFVKKVCIFSVFSLNCLVLNFKTWKVALKSRDRRRLAADRYQYKTL